MFLTVESVCDFLIERFCLMATVEQIKSLIKSHIKNEHDQFRTIALQVAAHEAVIGHSSVANEIRDLLDKKPLQRKHPLVIPYTPDFENLVSLDERKVYRNAMVLSSRIVDTLDRIIKEYRGRTKLEEFGMQYRRKVLLVGPPGTGKTMTASMLATALGLPLYRVSLDKIITKYMGETSSKLRILFDSMRERNGVYFFDEFDAIGSSRTEENDVGEMRRVINSFLQFIEQDPSNSVILAATNNPGMLDEAMFRRFDDVIEYEYPEHDQVEMLLVNTLTRFAGTDTTDTRILEEAKSLSQAEIVRACHDAIKEAILSNSAIVNAHRLIYHIKARKQARKSAFLRDK